MADLVKATMDLLSSSCKEKIGLEIAWWMRWLAVLLLLTHAIVTDATVSARNKNEKSGEIRGNRKEAMVTAARLGMRN